MMGLETQWVWGAAGVVTVAVAATWMVSSVVTKRQMAKKRAKSHKALGMAKEDRHYRSLIENMLNGFAYRHDAEGNFTYLSPSITKVLGYSEQDFLTYFETFHTDHPANQQVRRATELSMQGIEQPPYEVEIYHKNGERRWLEVAELPVQDEDGQVVAVEGIAHDITERKQVEQALAKSDARIRSIFRAAPTGIGVVSNRILTEVNDRMCEMIGYRREELVGQKSRILYFSDEDFEYVGREKYRQIEAFGTGTVEVQMRRKDGEAIDVLLSSTPLNPKDLKVGVTFTALDITERKQAERDLKLANERLAIAIRASRMGMWDWDIETGKVVRSREVAEILGYELKELESGKVAYSSLVHPDDRQRERQTMRAHLEGQTPFYECEYRLKAKDGQYRWLLAQGKVIERDSQGRALRMAGTNLDITERKESEQSLQRAHEQLNMAITGGDIGMWDWDMANNKVERNERLFEMLGYNREEYEQLARDYNLLVHPDDRRKGRDNLKEHILGHNDFVEAENRVRCKDGSYKWILSKGKAVKRDANGIALRIVGTNIDITERKNTQAQREALIKQLEEKNAEMERFVYTVSHDLKSPLITIRGYLGMLPTDIRRGELAQVDDDINRIFNATDRMKDLLHDLLELSRVGRVDKEREPVNMTALANEALEVVVQDSVNQEVDIVIQPDMPTMVVERVHMREVFQNLIDNAIKFTGDVAQPRIEVGYHNDEKAGIFYVKDNGTGIEPQYCDKVFELFQQLTPGKEGTGIGLAIVKRVIEVHGGKIWTESQGADQGATFCFTLPQDAEFSG